jgi:hypothetical protein
MAPASLAVANATPTLFTVSVTTSGSAALPAPMGMRFRPISGLRLRLLLVVLLFVLRKFRKADKTLLEMRLAIFGALAAVLLCTISGSAGCGGGGGSPANALPPTQQIVTPSGTSTIVLTSTAMSSSGAPLQLQPIQLTLTVK